MGFQPEHAAHTAAWLFHCVSGAWLSGGFVTATVLCRVLHRERDEIIQHVPQSRRWRTISVQIISLHRQYLFCSFGRSLPILSHECLAI